MALFITSCWLYLTSSLFFLIKFIALHVFRIKMNYDYSSQKAIEDFPLPLKPEPKKEEEEEEEQEEEPTDLNFRFAYQVPNMSSANHDENISKISNYSFLSKRDFSGFIENPETLTFSIHESFIDHNEAKIGSKPNLESKDDMLFLKENEVKERFSGFDSDSDWISLSDGYSVKDHVFDSESDEILSERGLIDSSSFEEKMENFEEGQSFNSICEDFRVGEGNIHEVEEFNPENEYHMPKFPISSILQTEPMDSSDDEFPISSKLQTEPMDSRDDEFPVSSNLQTEPMVSRDEFLVLSNLQTESICSGDDEFPVSGNLQTEPMVSRDDEFLISGNLQTEPMVSRDDEFPILSYLQTESIESSDDEFPDSENVSNLTDTEVNHKNLEFNAEFHSTNDDHQQVEEPKSRDLNNEEVDELESLWEHEDLVKQLKLELKRVRTGGLPTIFEDSESPKITENFKSWKIDVEFLKEDPMDELHKFYKSYRERLRKFDILNYQKMYAIGFLQLKNPLESMGAKKPLIPAIISHLSQNLMPMHRRKSNINPSDKFMKELQIDLETVYVGQTCLSWEFLRWQYEIARVLPDSDPYRSHQYNQVAVEFQQFQVLLQRFIENEPFQGPRLQNYVQNRCVLQNLLQVPVIKADCLKDKMEEKRRGKDSITSEMLEDIMEETIRIFWEFIKADKGETSILLKGLIRSQVELQDPSDFKLMSDIQTTLQKKEKKSKDILKIGNCLVKKFKKPQEDRSNRDLFFSQIDMKLVSRVLKMSRITTDQLDWCHKKLNKITVSDRKIHREPTFLLFPC